MPERQVEAALAYAKRGFSVIPLWPRTKVPALVKGAIYAYRRKPASERTLARWFSDERNVGISTGLVSHIIVLDVDGDDGRKSLNGLPMPPSPTVITGDGHHVYCRHPGGVIKSALKALPGLDVLAEQRYAVAPPSLHPDGPRYEWHEFLDLNDLELAEVPAWVLDLLPSPAPPPARETKKQQNLIVLRSRCRKNRL